MAGQQPQAEQNQNPDLTAAVPNEVLCLVFSHISSFTDKFRLAAVNKRFRECVIKEMKKPVPLDVEMMWPGWNWVWGTFLASEMRCQLNDMFIDRTLDHLTKGIEHLSKMNTRFDNAVQALAVACKFSKITVRIGAVDEEHQYRLFELLGQTDCLNQVTTFEVIAAAGGNRSRALAKALIRCDKLSFLRLYSINYDHDFTQALKDKHLTELVLELGIYTHQQVIELFQSLKPNTLRKLQLTHHRDPLMFSELVKQLRSSWTTVEEIYFEGWSNLPLPDYCQMFEAMAGLPSLQLCHVRRFWIDRPAAEFSANLATLFNLSGVDKNLTLELDASFIQSKKGCWFVGVIGQIQEHHPALQIELTLSHLKLVLGAVSIIMSMDASRAECSNDVCVPCRHFYPNVIQRLSKKAALKVDGHLDNYRLDRCKVNNVIADWNKLRNRWWSNKIKGKQANEEQDQVTVTFEAADHQPFRITINTGHCLENSCIRCEQID